MTQPQIVFFGTPEFAAESLKALIAAKFDITAVVTMPDAPAGRSKKILSSPVKILAEQHSIPVIQPDTLRQETTESLIPRMDLGIVVAYGKILPQWLLSKPRYGMINIHASLLPAYRGPAPIHAALLNGNRETGITLMRIDEKLDHGPILAQETVTIAEDDNYQSLSHKLAACGAALLVRTIPAWIAEEITPREQDHEKATYTKILTKEDGHVDWNLQAREVQNRMRAYSLWPQCWSIASFSNTRMRIKLLTLTTTDRPIESSPPGTILVENQKLLVAARDYFLEIITLQPESRSPMSAEDFIRGFHIAPDAHFE